MAHTIRQIIEDTSLLEDGKTQRIFEKLRGVRLDEGLTYEQVFEILMWKSPRAKRHYEKNKSVNVQEITKKAFAEENIEILVQGLKGVNYPAASAILMFYNPKKFPVIDIRVWKVLYATKEVTTNPNGQNFNLNEWNVYLKKVRELAQELGLTAREIEKKLFTYSEKTQEGLLYE